MPGRGMRPQDLIVEVRDRDLVRVGQIETQYLDLRATLKDPAEGPGEWQVRLPAEHRLVPALQAEGSGIIVTHVDRRDDPLLSGVRDMHTNVADQDDPRGMVTVPGFTDDVLLWNRAAYPTPTTSDLAAQGEYDTQSDVAETVWKHYVTANIALGPSPRRVGLLDVAPDQRRGGRITVNARFDPIGELIGGTAVLAGVRPVLRQVGSRLAFDVVEPRDLRGLVELDLRNGTLASHSAEFTRFGLTYAIVMGQGQAEARRLLGRTSALAQASEVAWGPHGRIERAIDARQGGDDAALAQSGDEALLEAQGRASVKAVPSDDQTMRWPFDWDVMDRVGVIIGGQPTSARVSSVALIVDSGGVKIGAGIGDVLGWSPTAALERRQDLLERRLATLERHTGTL